MRCRHAPGRKLEVSAPAEPKAYFWPAPGRKLVSRADRCMRVSVQRTFGPGRAKSCCFRLGPCQKLFLPVICPANTSHHRFPPPSLANVSRQRLPPSFPANVSRHRFPPPSSASVSRQRFPPPFPANVSCRHRFFYKTQSKVGI